MRLAIFSDVHGNLAALEAVLADIERRGPFDAFGVAGDLCEWGPQPREVLERLRALAYPVVQGNTDYNVVQGNTDHSVVQGNTDYNVVPAEEEEQRAPGRSASSIEARAWTIAQIGIEGVAYLSTLPSSHTFSGPDGGDVLMVHANACDQTTHLHADASPKRVAKLLGGSTANTIVFGHLHTPYARRVAGRLLVNVSSVGYPRDGDHRAAYAELTWDGVWHATIRRVAYDLEATVAAFEASGMPRGERRIAALYRAGYASALSRKAG